MANLSIFSSYALKKGALDHVNLMFYFRVGLRRKTWGGLGGLEKALYKCALWVAKMRGRITNMKLSASIRQIIAKLLVAVSTRIYALGLTRARMLRNKCLSGGVFEWAPEVETLLFKPDYITFLGAMELNRVI
jgi:hypothetical protein